MFEDAFLLDNSPIMRDRKEEEVIDEYGFFIKFLNLLEGWKTKCENLHWAAPKKNIHVYLDDFLKILQNYQDSLAEEFQGLLGHMPPNKITGTPSDSLNAMDFILEVKKGTIEFYEAIPTGPCYVGIRSECETFIHNILKYKYLFELTDAKKLF